MPTTTETDTIQLLDRIQHVKFNGTEAGFVVSSPRRVDVKNLLDALGVEYDIREVDHSDGKGVRMYEGLVGTM